MEDAMEASVVFIARSTWHKRSLQARARCFSLTHTRLRGIHQQARGGFPDIEYPCLRFA